MVILSKSQCKLPSTCYCFCEPSSPSSFAKGDHLHFGHLRVRDLGAALPISARHARSSRRGQSDLLQFHGKWSRWSLASRVAVLGRSEASDEGRRHYERLDKAIQGQSDGCMWIQLRTVRKIITRSIVGPLPLDIHWVYY